MIRLEKRSQRLRSPRSRSDLAMLMLQLEWKPTRSSYKAVALCADVEVAEREGGGAMVEDAVRKIAVVNVVVKVADVEA